VCLHRFLRGQIENNFCSIEPSHMAGRKPIPLAIKQTKGAVRK
jgi:hypothetical protein